MSSNTIKVPRIPMIVFLVISTARILAQDIDLSKTTELQWQTDEFEKHLFSGYSEKNPVLIHRRERRANDFNGIVAFEKSKETKILPSKFKPPYPSSNLLTGYVDLEVFNNASWLYRELFSNDDFTVYYQNLWLQYKEKDYLLDSIYNADKLIHSSFSNDGRYLLVNTLNTLSDYYNPDQDNRIMVYDLGEIDSGKIEKKHIECLHCSDSYLVGDQLFFTIGRKDGYDGFSNKDIYVAPWGSLQDSVKIARNTDIVSISPDGKYILGKRFWDRQQTTAVIVDVEQKKYQMLIGRDYAKRRAFYSYHENKFAFDFKGYLIYVDFPKSYPFDALKWRNEEIPDWTEEVFWKQFEHEPLPEN